MGVMAPPAERNELEDEQLWPFLEEKKPRVVTTAQDFVQELLFGHHGDGVTVLRNGIELLNQTDALPTELVDSLAKCSRVSQLFDHVPHDFAERIKGRLWQYETKGAESEIKKADKLNSLTEIRDCLRDGQENGSVDVDVPLYISEMRNNRKVAHPITGELVKTATQVDVFDALPQVTLAPFWERSEGGIFIGERGAGSGLHVDQCLWSNVGRQWSGYKLFAVWPWTERISILEDAGRGSLFHFPLTEEEVGYLQRASVVALLRPGDVFVFSGGVPHMAMCVSDHINVSAYESIVPLNHLSIARLSLTNSKSHFKRCWMDDDDLDELLEDVVDSIVGNQLDRNVDEETQRELTLCEEAMKEHGDSYCKRLWRREDSRRKRARLCPITDRNALLHTWQVKRQRRQ